MTRAVLFFLVVPFATAAFACAARADKGVVCAQIARQIGSSYIQMRAVGGEAAASSDLSASTQLDVVLACPTEQLTTLLVCIEDKARAEFAKGMVQVSALLRDTGPCFARLK